MTRLALLPGTALGRYYSSAAIPSWEAGQVREVAPEHATYLTSTFPDCFVEQSDPKPEPRQPAPSIQGHESVPESVKKKSTRRGGG